jgi:uncharacterized protein YggE
MEIFEGTSGGRLRMAVFVAVVLVSVFLAVQVMAGVQGLRYIGAGIAPANTIAVSGRGEVQETPDIATISFSVVSEKSTVAAAQSDATTKANAVTAYLVGAGIEKKDIQTSNYSVSPQYDYLQSVCTNGYCPGGKQVLRGYEVRQSTTVKVRDLTKAGDILTGVGEKGATEVSGLQFTFDDPNAPLNDARTKAIADAKTKADVLAKQLGVTLVRVVSFNENSGGGNPRPMVAYAQASDSKAASAPEISPGQNTVTDDVQITYEIR